MTRQWQGLLKNLGVWNGTFASYSISGELLTDVPSQLTLALSGEEQRVDFCLERYPQGQPVSTINLSFQYPGPGPQIPFFEQGAFSQGPLQYSSYSRFGAELSMIWGDRRVRIVQQYPAGSIWEDVTLICETRTQDPPSEPLCLDHFWGQWTGEAQTLFADSRDMATYPTQLRVERLGDRVQQTLQIADQQIQTTGIVRGTYVDFESGAQPMRLLLLPGGASSLAPLTIHSGAAFFLEAGWLIEPHLRQRLIRRYSDRGEWESLTLVTEQKQAEGGKSQC